MVIWSSYLYSGIYFTGKIILYWIGALFCFPFLEQNYWFIESPRTLWDFNHNMFCWKCWNSFNWLLYTLPMHILTHWGRVTHICISKLTIIGSDNGLPPNRRQAVIGTNAGILLIRTLGTNFSEILGEIHSFSFKEMHFKMSSAKRRLFSLGLNELSWCLLWGTTLDVISTVIFTNIWLSILLVWDLSLPMILKVKDHWLFHPSNVVRYKMSSWIILSYHLPYSATETVIFWGWHTSDWLWFHRKMISGDSKVMTSSVKCHRVQSSVVMMELSLAARIGQFHMSTVFALSNEL